jgi:hypothetical protein
VKGTRSVSDATLRCEGRNCCTKAEQYCIRSDSELRIQKLLVEPGRVKRVVSRSAVGCCSSCSTNRNSIHSLFVLTLRLLEAMSLRAARIVDASGTEIWYEIRGTPSAHRAHGTDSRVEICILIRLRILVAQRSSSAGIGSPDVMVSKY